MASFPNFPYKLVSCALAGRAGGGGDGGSYVIKGVQKGKATKFSLKGAIDDPTGMYIVSVHIDVDGDGQASAGDYITTGYHEVAAEGASDLEVRVQKVP
jgi:hypothetical protein